MFRKEFNSVLDFQDSFPNEQSCIDFLEMERWNGNVKVHLMKSQKSGNARTTGTTAKTAIGILA